MMHYILTRAVYDPALWTLDENHRRLEIFKNATCRSLKAQDPLPGSTWVLAIHPADPFKVERLASVAATGLDIAWINYPHPTTTRADVAMACYRLPWSDEIDSSSKTLTTRLDDDDALTGDNFTRLYAAADILLDRRVLMFPTGHRIHNGRYTAVTHETNAMATLHTPPGDTDHVYSFRHRKAKKYAPVTIIDDKPAWLWVRHPDTLSGYLAASKPITDRITNLYPINWHNFPTTPIGPPVPGGERFT